MPINGHNYSKLIPLRRFVLPGLYELPYLSLLVQRGKLKAERVGRNYFTTREWFDDYLETHAREEKREAYRRAAAREQAQGRTIIPAREIKTAAENKGALTRWQAAVFGAAVFLLFLFGFWLGWHEFREQGRVAGESESFTESGIMTADTAPGL